MWLRPLRIPEDMPIVQRWVSQERAGYWGLVGQSLEQVTTAYREIVRRAQVYLGFHEDAPSFLVECYDPAEDGLGAHYSVQPGDRGMHILVAPAVVPRSGFTWACFSTVMDFMFDDPSTQRVVVEPDIRNSKIHALNRRARFAYQKVIELPGKSAHLAFCTRERYFADAPPAPSASGAETIAHLRPDVWAAVNAWLVRKLIAEFSHELLLEPTREALDGPAQEGWQRFAFESQPGIFYRFRARILPLHHWDIELGSLEKSMQGQRAPLDALQLVIELAQQVEIDPQMLPVYLEEISSTLYAAAHKHAHQRFSAADLVHADFQEIEAAMAEGHPGFVANSGRVGFDARDYLAYAPENAAPVRLVWLAAHRRRAEFNAVDGLSHGQLLRSELGADVVESFERALEQQGLDPRSYVFMPVHPWQWSNKLALVFAADIAARDLVYLGPGEDSYQAQQSIRTFFNLSNPRRRYVKTALSVLNMGFMRGLSAEYMQSTPAINQWIDELVRCDAYLAKKSFAILRELASVGYRSPYLEAAAPKQSPYRKMLAALWRDSPLPQLEPGQRLMTMAALLHRDREGRALLPQLIKAAGVDIDSWLRRYLDCYFAPLVHCFYCHDLAFMPHGENVILVLQDHLPVKAFMKDIGEEVAIADPRRAVPRKVQRICIEVPDELKTLHILTDVFDGFFRYLAQVLREQTDYAPERFWRLVAECLTEYRREQPQLAQKMDRYDLFAAEFRRSCLNRLQLRDNTQMVDLSDPVKNLKFAGTLSNPIAAFKSAVER
jgi:siderophore synthetase component